MGKIQTLKKYKKSDCRYMYMLLAAAAVLFNIYFDMQCYQDYQDKMYILEQMVTADQNAVLDKAIGLLKAEKMQPVSFLEEYGYKNGSQNRYYMNFKRQCAITAVYSVILLGALLAVMYFQENQRRIKIEAYLKNLGQCLSDFRENKDFSERFHKNDPINTEEPDEQQERAVSRFPVLEGFESATDYISGRLEQLAEQLALTQEQAHMEKEKTRSVVTDISHQLKTPVAALDTCFTVLEDVKLQEAEYTEFYHRCRNELEGLKVLLDSLFQISRLETGLIQLERRQVLLMDTVISAVNRIYPKASEKQIELVFDHEPEAEQLMVMQDKKWFCEALVNVLDNAVKYSPCGSEIQIRMRKGLSFVKIEIADQGIGIAKQDYHKVFQRFYRGSSKWVREESGSGVGLYLVREIISKHQGMVSIKAGYGNDREFPGSVIEIQMPAG